MHVQPPSPPPPRDPGEPAPPFQPPRSFSPSRQADPSSQKGPTPGVPREQHVMGLVACGGISLGEGAVQMSNTCQPADQCVECCDAFVGASEGGTSPRGPRAGSQWREGLAGLGKHGLHVASHERVPPLLQLHGSRSQLSNAPPSIFIHRVLSELRSVKSRHPSRHCEPSRGPRGGLAPLAPLATVRISETPPRGPRAPRAPRHSQNQRDPPEGASRPSTYCVAPPTHGVVLLQLREAPAA